MNIFTFSKPSVLLLHYGLFAVICHTTAIFLFSTTFPVACPIVYHHKIFPMLEHSLLSFVIVFIGVLGFEYIFKDIDNKQNK